MGEDSYDGNVDENGKDNGYEDGNCDNVDKDGKDENGNGNVDEEDNDDNRQWITEFGNEVKFQK